MFRAPWPALSPHSTPTGETSRWCPHPSQLPSCRQGSDAGRMLRPQKAHGGPAQAQVRGGSTCC